jgi:hypothetical protein
MCNPALAIDSPASGAPMLVMQGKSMSDMEKVSPWAPQLGKPLDRIGHLQRAQIPR